MKIWKFMWYEIEKNHFLYSLERGIWKRAEMIWYLITAFIWAFPIRMIGTVWGEHMVPFKKFQDESKTRKNYDEIEREAETLNESQKFALYLKWREERKSSFCWPAVKREDRRCRRRKCRKIKIRITKLWAESQCGKTVLHSVCSFRRYFIQNDIDRVCYVRNIE